MQIKKFLALVMTLSMISISLVSSGCNDGGKGESENSDNIMTGNTTVDVWSHTNADRILQDKQYDKNSRNVGKLYISASRNEREGGQIIFTPEGDMKGYKVECFDLKDSDGNLLKKENFKVYHQMYKSVVAPSAGYSLGLGDYPDALLPLETANKFGETFVHGGENQGISFILSVPSDQKSGIYKGNFSLTAGGGNYTIPVEVEIYDYDLSKTTSTESCFILSRHYMQRYGDSTLENYKRYYEYLVDHRVMPMHLPVLIGDPAIFADEVIKYAKRDDITSMAIPSYSDYSPVYGGIDVVWPRLMEYTRQIAIKSIESNVNAMAKCYYYFGCIDEAGQWGGEELAARICAEARKRCKELADELQNDKTLKGENKEEVIASLIKLPCFETSQFIDSMYKDGEGVRNWCPQFKYFDTAEQRKLYSDLAKEDKIWWYGCIGPDHPYPTYQIDDYLLSSRIVSWMQKDYNISGNLYWETTYWKKSLTGEKADMFHGDAMNFNNDNGDGYLLYPGDVYEIDGPVGSIRLESICDGLEEYEVLKDIEECYKAKSLDANVILNTYYSQLYKDAMMKEGAEFNFDAVRDDMYRTAVLCKNYDTFIQDIQQEESSVIYKVLASKDVKLYNNNKLLNGTNSKIQDYNLYTINVNLDKERNTFNITAEKGGKKAYLDIDLGGKKIKVDQFEENSSKDNVKSDNGTISIVDGSDLGFTSKVLKVDFAEKLPKVQMVKFMHPQLKQLDNLSKIIMDIKVDGKPVDVKVYVSIKGKDILIPVGSQRTENGCNTIIINNTTTHGKLGEIEYIALQFGSKGDEARTIYIDNVVIQA